MTYWSRTWTKVRVEVAKNSASINTVNAQCNV
jgi:hypothetical protein